jgi:hypothetical protein
MSLAWLDMTINHFASKEPNFFIVGAPKCGTSAMYHYLGQHPEIFIPDTSDNIAHVLGGKREFHYFGSDLPFSRLSRNAYLAYFAQASDEKRLGECSVFYLYSQRASAEIKRFAPNAHIIIMLRNPVDMMHAWYAQLVYWGDEHVAEFDTALQLEPKRKQGLCLPKTHDHPLACFFYREIASYTVQIKRYLDQFGRDHVHIIIFDDFKTHTAEAYRQTLRFLDVDDHFQPKLHPINANKQVRSRMLNVVLRRPPASLRGVGKRILPHTVRQRWRMRLLRYNTMHVSRAPLDVALRQQLQAEFAPDVEQLSQLLNRDLTYWCRP